MGNTKLVRKEVRNRDKFCIYCSVTMTDKLTPGGSRKTVASWEHIVNDANIVTRENIALCCVSCNASKGTKDLSDWLQSNYCLERGITKDTVADIVKKVLQTEPNVAT